MVPQMKTNSMLSTITYNSTEFLKCKLDELVLFKKIDFYAFIFHKREETEKKDHIHLFLIPSASIDTRQIDEYLIEPVKNSKPLGTCTIWSKVAKNCESDWFLYGLHDMQYLRMKGLSREHFYLPDDFVSSSKEALDNFIYDAYHTSKFCFHNHIIRAYNESKDVQQTTVDLVLNGYVPLQNMTAIHHLSQILKGM